MPSRRDSRIVITRDRELLKRRSITHGCFVHTLKSEQQFREIFDRLDLARSARPFTLCMHCNAPLRSIEKELVEHRLPPTVRMHHEHFTICDACQRIFWKGSHWQRMRSMLDDVLPRQ